MNAACGIDYYDCLHHSFPNNSEEEGILSGITTIIIIMAFDIQLILARLVVSSGHSNTFNLQTFIMRLELLLLNTSHAHDCHD